MSTAVAVRPAAEIAVWTEPVDPVSLAKRERDRRAVLKATIENAMNAVKKAFTAIGRAAQKALRIIKAAWSAMFRSLRKSGGRSGKWNVRRAGVRQRRAERARQRAETPERSRMHANYQKRRRGR